MGYDNGDEVKKGLEEGLVPDISKPQTSAKSKLGLFGKEECISNPAKDCYRCPAGQAFTLRFETVENDRHLSYYSTSACRACPLKPTCTRKKENRRITRWVHEGLLEARQQRVTANPEKVRLRKRLVEHPFGTIQRGMDQGDFLPRGRAKVRAEMRRTGLADNLKRVSTILGVKQRIAAVR
jgi:transposase